MTHLSKFEEKNRHATQLKETADTELRARFESLGWGVSQQAQTIFDLLVQARNQVQPGETILDLGAGECRYRFFFEKCNYISVDFGKGDAGWDYSSLDLIGDITRLDFIKDESVQYVLNTVVLEHINEPGQLLSHISRILQPGGKLFLYVPFVGGEHQVPYDYYRYTSYGLRHLCERAGLTVLELTPSNTSLETGLTVMNSTIVIGESRDLPTRAVMRVMQLGVRAVQLLYTRLRDGCMSEEGDRSFPIAWTLIAQKQQLEDKQR